jgi:hypothetical protein
MSKKQQKKQKQQKQLMDNKIQQRVREDNLWGKIKILFKKHRGKIVTLLVLPFLAAVFGNMATDYKKDIESKRQFTLQVISTEELVEQGLRDEALEQFNELSKTVPSDKYPELYARVRYGQGVCNELGKKNEENLIKAVKYYNDALKEFPYSKYPFVNMRIYGRLGRTYLALSEIRDSEKNITKAMQAFESAKSIYQTQSIRGKEKALGLIDLGEAYLIMASIGNPNQNLSTAKTYFQEAQSIIQTEDAELQRRLNNDFGFVYYANGFNSKSKDEVKLGIEFFEKGLTETTAEKFPLRYAVIKNNIGNAYRCMGVLTDDLREKGFYFKWSELALKDSLKLRVKDKYPEDYAIATLNLGITYYYQSKIDEPVQNLEKSIKAYQDALNVFTLERYPIRNAATKLYLGDAFYSLGSYDDAIQAYKDSTEVFSEKVHPDKYEQAMLGIAKAMKRTIINKGKQEGIDLSAFEDKTEG